MRAVILADQSACQRARVMEIAQTILDPELLGIGRLFESRNVTIRQFALRDDEIAAFKYHTQCRREWPVVVQLDRKIVPREIKCRRALQPIVSADDIGQTVAIDI